MQAMDLTPNSRVIRFTRSLLPGRSFDFQLTFLSQQMKGVLVWYGRSEEQHDVVLLTASMPTKLKEVASTSVYGDPLPSDALTNMNENLSGSLNIPVFVAHGLADLDGKERLFIESVLREEIQKQLSEKQ